MRLPGVYLFLYFNSDIFLRFGTVSFFVYFFLEKINPCLDLDILYFFMRLRNFACRRKYSIAVNKENKTKRRKTT